MVTVSRTTSPGLARSSNLLGERPAAKPAAHAPQGDAAATSSRQALREKLDLIARLQDERVGDYAIFEREHEVEDDARHRLLDCSFVDERRLARAHRARQEVAARFPTQLEIERAAGPATRNGQRKIDACGPADEFARIEPDLDITDSRG